MPDRVDADGRPWCPACRAHVPRDAAGRCVDCAAAPARARRIPHAKPPASPAQGPAPTPPPEWQARAAELAAIGLTTTAVARRVGRDPGHVRRVLRRKSRPAP